MNDLTPGRLKGTLLERAAALYDLAPPPLPPGAPEPVRESPIPPRAVAAQLAKPLARPRRRSGPVVRIDRQALLDAGMIVPGAAVSALAEEFRLVKRQLLTTARAVEATAPERARAVLICSANPGDGKTFCALNLALSLAAEKDLEVLLVDADFAKPDVLARLGLAEESRGLLDALADPTIDVEDCILATDVPQLSILPAGTKTHFDTELVASARARTVIESLVRGSPDRLVIFDSPPALAASAASVLAGLVGQVMLIVRADRTSEGDLRNAVALLDGCDQLQLVLNSVSLQPGGRRFGQYYHQEAAQ
jgi:exopolysaccharide/PEP-CTERM locus tyrosine autokinase